MMIAQIVQKLFGPVFQGLGARGTLPPDGNGGEEFAELVQDSAELGENAAQPAAMPVAPFEGTAFSKPLAQVMFLDAGDNENVQFGAVDAVDPASNGQIFGHDVDALAGLTYNNSNANVIPGSAAELPIAAISTEISANEKQQKGAKSAESFPEKGDKAADFQMFPRSDALGEPDTPPLSKGSAPAFGVPEIGQPSGPAPISMPLGAAQSMSLVHDRAPESAVNDAFPTQFEPTDLAKTGAGAVADDSRAFAGASAKSDENAQQIDVEPQAEQLADFDTSQGKQNSAGLQILRQIDQISAHVLGANVPNVPNVTVATAFGPNPAQFGETVQRDEKAETVVAASAPRTPLDSAAQLVRLDSANVGDAPPAAVAAQNRTVAWQAFERYMFEQRGDVLGANESFADLGASFSSDMRGAGPAVAPAAGSTSAPTPAFGPALSAQIVSHAAAAQSGPVEITLNPIELGQLRFEIQQSGESVQIILSAERGETLDLLRRNSDQLLADFRAAGFGGASLAFGGWGAGHNKGFAAQSDDRAPDTPIPAQAAQPAAFATPRPVLDQSRSLNIRL